MNTFQHKKNHKPPLLPVFISSVIQFDKFFHPVALYENDSLAYSRILMKTLIIRENIFQKILAVQICFGTGSTTLKIPIWFGTESKILELQICFGTRSTSLVIPVCFGTKSIIPELRICLGSSITTLKIHLCFGTKSTILELRICYGWHKKNHLEDSCLFWYQEYHFGT